MSGIIPQTGVAWLDWFLSLLDNWGYLIVFGATVFENLFVLGSFTPGETVVVAGSFVAARGLLFLPGVWMASMLGTLVGSNVSYFLGKRAGLDAVRAFVERAAATRIGRIVRINASGLDEVHDHFHTQGAKTVLISRFAVGAKNFVPAMAGATGMPVFWFELYTLIGAVIYTSAMCIVGWFLGENFDQAMAVVSRIGIAGLLLFAGFIASLVWARHRVGSRSARKKEARKGQLQEDGAAVSPEDSGEGAAPNNQAGGS